MRLRELSGVGGWGGVGAICSNLVSVKEYKILCVYISIKNTKDVLNKSCLTHSPSPHPI